MRAFSVSAVSFGLASAPSAFQKMMSTIIAGLPGVQAYLDDVICYGVTSRIMILTYGGCCMPLMRQDSN